MPASARPLVATPPDARCELCVTIPVHNEEAGIAATLAALAAQVDAAGRPLDPERYEVLVLANNCTDATVARARRFAADHPAPAAARHRGLAARNRTPTSARRGGWSWTRRRAGCKRSAARAG